MEKMETTDNHYEQRNMIKEYHRGHEPKHPAMVRPGGEELDLGDSHSDAEYDVS